MTPQSPNAAKREAVQSAPDPNLPVPTDGGGAKNSVNTLPTTGLGAITKAIATVMQEIDTVAKRGQNAFHKYRYARMEDILRRLTPLLGKHGLVVFQDEVGRSMFDDDGVIAVCMNSRWRTKAARSGHSGSDKPECRAAATVRAVGTTSQSTSATRQRENTSCCHYSKSQLAKSRMRIKTPTIQSIPKSRGSCG
jgi:hypothetical protein